MNAREAGLVRKHRAIAHIWRTIERVLATSAFLGLGVVLIAVLVLTFNKGESSINRTTVVILASVFAIALIPVSIAIRLIRHRRRQHLEILYKNYENQDPGDQPYILFLRPFSVRASTMSIMHQFELPDVICRYLTSMGIRGTVIAIQDPNSVLPIPGVDNIHADHAQWQAKVESLADEAIAIILVPGRGPGIFWEAQMLAKRGLLFKSLFLIDRKHTSLGSFRSFFKGRALQKFVETTTNIPISDMPRRCYSIFFSDGETPSFGSGHIPNMSPMADTYNLLHTADVFISCMIEQWRRTLAIESWMRRWCLFSADLRDAALQHSVQQYYNEPSMRALISTTNSNHVNVWREGDSAYCICDIGAFLPLMTDYLFHDDGHCSEFETLSAPIAPLDLRLFLPPTRPRPRGTKRLACLRSPSSAVAHPLPGKDLVAIAFAVPAFIEMDWGG